MRAEKSYCPGGAPEAEQRPDAKQSKDPKGSKQTKPIHSHSPRAGHRHMPCGSKQVNCPGPNAAKAPGAFGGAHLVLVLLLRALRINQKRGRQGSHNAQVPNTILPSESDMLACITSTSLSVNPVTALSSSAKRSASCHAILTMSVCYHYHQHAVGAAKGNAYPSSKSKKP